MATNKLEPFLKKINTLEYQSLEFMKITGFTLEQFKQLYLAGIIKLESGNDSIKYIAEIHQKIKTFGLQFTIEALRNKPEPLTNLKLKEMLDK